MWVSRYYTDKNSFSWYATFHETLAFQIIPRSTHGQPGKRITSLVVFTQLSTFFHSIHKSSVNVTSQEVSVVEYARVTYKRGDWQSLDNFVEIILALSHKRIHRGPTPFKCVRNSNSKTAQNKSIGNTILRFRLGDWGYWGCRPHF